MKAHFKYHVMETLTRHSKNVREIIEWKVILY